MEGGVGVGVSVGLRVRNARGTARERVRFTPTKKWLAILGRSRAASLLKPCHIRQDEGSFTA